MIIDFNKINYLGIENLFKEEFFLQILFKTVECRRIIMNVIFFYYNWGGGRGGVRACKRNL